MKILSNIPREKYPEVLQRPVEVNPGLAATVRDIISRVEQGGDQALRDLSREIDHYESETFEWSPESLQQAGQQVPQELKAAISRSVTNIEAFHRAQLPRPIEVETMPGIHCSMRFFPIERVGLYIPGGTAPLLSSVLMTAVPARLAGCREIIVCTPPGAPAALLYTLSLFNVRVFALGGAQAIAAMALGTESIPKVDKVFGPGNAYVTEAKMQLAGRGLAIDLPAGPSEVMVIADGSANPAFVAADLLSQAEHGEDSQVILLATSMEMVRQTLEEIRLQVRLLPRKAVAEKTLENSLAMVVVDLEEAVAASNFYGPEHLILSVENPGETAGRIHNAGSVFLGNHTPESAGDYASGTNHTLPTGGFSRAWSGITTMAFMKSITFQEISPEGLRSLAPTVIEMAGAEQLQAHANAVSIRLADRSTMSADPQMAAAPQMVADPQMAAAREGSRPESGKPGGFFDLENLTRNNIRQLHPYKSARDEFSGNPASAVFLDANEQPMPLADLPEGINRYPKYAQDILKERLAAVKGVSPGQVFLGNGSDEAIDLILRCFAEPGRDSIMVFPPTFGMYAVSARINNLKVIEVPLDKAFRADPDAVIRALEPDCKVLFFCNPNNPTANTQDRETILRVMNAFSGIVVVDEAYIDFCPDESLLGELDKHPNLVVLQTFSKAWGLAGARVGVAYSAPGIISVLNKAKAPYNLSNPACQLAVRALNNHAEYRIGIRQTIRERDRLSGELADMPMVEKVYPSNANFLLVKTSDAHAVYTHLAAHGVVVRNRTNEPGCQGCLRITVGTADENHKLLRAWELLGTTTTAAAHASESRAPATPASAGKGQPSTAGIPEKVLPHRTATVRRQTAETDITIRLGLDGTGQAGIDTGIGFFDHMLQQIARHGLFDLDIAAKGDLHIDVHHTLEDTAITLGQAFRQALGDKRGVERYGFALPMDDSEAKVLIDFGGRTFFKWKVRFNTNQTGEVPTSLYPHFFRSFSEAAACNLHIKSKGADDHHIIEAVFKAFAKALRMAVTRNPSGVLPTTKGSI
jgi:histidinol dehydrogenase